MDIISGGAALFGGPVGAIIGGAMQGIGAIADWKKQQHEKQMQSIMNIRNRMQ